MECKICNKEIQNNKGMSYHFTTIHKLDYIQYLIDNQLIEIPKCLHCNNNIDILKGIGRTKILNHPEELIYCSNKCKLNDENYKKKMSINGIKGGHSIRIMSKEAKQRKSLKMKKMWKDKKYAKMMSESNKGKLKSDEHRKHISESRKGMKFTKEHRNKISKTISQKYINGDFLSHKAEVEGIKFMSSYEINFASFLNSNKEVINWKYQPFILFNKKLQKRYIPDFLVEFKSGEKWLVEIDRYKGFKEKYGQGWKIELGKKYCSQNNLIYQYLDKTDIEKLLKLKQENQMENNTFVQWQKYLEENYGLSLYYNYPITFEAINEINYSAQEIFDKFSIPIWGMGNSLSEAQNNNIKNINAMKRFMNDFNIIPDEFISHFLF